MNQTLTADDLLPLVLKLSRDEQKRLAQLALEAAAQSISSADQPGVRAALEHADAPR